jgi:hypothetical protein
MLGSPWLPRILNVRLDTALDPGEYPHHTPSRDTDCCLPEGQTRRHSRPKFSGLNTFKVGSTRDLCTSPAFVPTHRRTCYQTHRKARYWARGARLPRRDFHPLEHAALPGRTVPFSLPTHQSPQPNTASRTPQVAKSEDHCDGMTGTACRPENLACPSADLAETDRVMRTGSCANSIRARGSATTLIRCRIYSCNVSFCQKQRFPSCITGRTIYGQAQRSPPYRQVLSPGPRVSGASDSS